MTLYSVPASQGLISSLDKTILLRPSTYCFAVVNLVLLFSGLIGTVVCQTPTNTLGQRLPSALEKVDEQVSKVIANAEDHFRKGKLNLDDDKREMARAEFDSAVDVILESGMDIRANRRLQAFYMELVERIYREEVPLGHGLPVTRTGRTVSPKVGFRDQSFDPAPLDELSKLVLGSDMGETSPKTNENSRTCNKPPSIRNLYLGMSDVQLKKLYPSAIVVRKRVEISEVVFAVRGRSDTRLNGVGTLFGFFFEGKLFLLSVDYVDQIAWTGIDQFVMHFSRALDMPTTWDRHGTARVLRCSNFFVTADMVAGSPRVGLVDSAAHTKRNIREANLKSPANFRP